LKGKILDNLAYTEKTIENVFAIVSLHNLENRLHRLDLEPEQLLTLSMQKINDDEKLFLIQRTK